MRHTDRCVAHNVQGKNSRILDSTGRRSIANAVIVSPPSQLRDTGSQTEETEVIEFLVA